MNKKIINFQDLIVNSTRGFVGREWVIKAIDDFLEIEAPQYFLLLGEPGCGKTSFISSLLRKRSYPHHFVGRGSQSGLAPSFDWRDPVRFAESIGYQLLRDYGGWIMNWDQWGIQVNQRVKELHGQLVGVQIEHFDAIPRAANKPLLTVTQEVERFGEAAQLIGVYVETLAMDIEQIVRELLISPLRTISARWPSHQLVIVVDGLDEAESYSNPQHNILRFLQDGDLPRNVRFLLTSRPGEHLTPDFISRSRVFWLSENESGERNPNIYLDAKAYAAVLAAERSISERLASRNVAPDVFAEQVATASQGNFLYLYFYAQAIRGGDIDLLDLDALPQGLYGIYADFLSKIKLQRGDVSWNNAYKPVLGTLAVAREPLTRRQIAQFSGVSQDTTAAILMLLRQFLQSSLKDNERYYAVYHVSLCHYLTSNKNEDYIDGPTAHQRIGNYYMKNHQEQQWRNCDTYGLLHVAKHISESIDGSLQIQDLFELINDVNYLERKLQLTRSLHSVCSDIGLALNRSLEQSDWTRVAKYGFMYADYSEGRFGKPNILELYKIDSQAARLEVRLYRERPRFRVLVLLALLEADAGRISLANELITEAATIKGYSSATSEGEFQVDWEKKTNQTVTTHVRMNVPPAANEGEFLRMAVATLFQAGCSNPYLLLYPALPPDSAAYFAAQIAPALKPELQMQVLDAAIGWLEHADKFPVQIRSELIEAFQEVSKSVVHIPDDVLRSKLVSKLERLIDAIPMVEKQKTSLGITSLVLVFTGSIRREFFDIKTVFTATLGATLIEQGFDEQGYTLLDQAVAACGNTIFSSNYGALTSRLCNLSSSRALKLFDRLLEVAKNYESFRNLLSIANALADGPSGNNREAMISALRRHSKALRPNELSVIEITVTKAFVKTKRKTPVNHLAIGQSFKFILHNPLIEPETKLAAIDIIADQLASANQQSPFWTDPWVKRIAKWINKISSTKSMEDCLYNLRNILDPFRPFVDGEDVLVGLRLVYELHQESLQAEAIRLVLNRVNRLSGHERASARTQVCLHILRLHAQIRRFEVLEVWLETADAEDLSQLRNLRHAQAFTDQTLQSKFCTQIAGVFFRLNQVQEAHTAWYDSIRFEDLAISGSALFATRIAAISRLFNAQSWSLVVDAVDCPDFEVAAYLVEVAAKSCVIASQLMDLETRLKHLQWHGPIIEYLLRMHLSLARGWIRLGKDPKAVWWITRGLSYYSRFNQELSNRGFRDVVRTTGLLSHTETGRWLLLQLIPNIFSSASRGRFAELAHQFKSVDDDRWVRYAFWWLFRHAMQPGPHDWRAIDAVVSIAGKLAEIGEHESAAAMINELQISEETQRELGDQNLYREIYKIAGLVRLARLTDEFQTDDRNQPALKLSIVLRQKLMKAILVMSHEYEDLVSKLPDLELDMAPGAPDIPASRIALQLAYNFAKALTQKNPFAAMRWEGLQMIAYIAADFGLDREALAIAEDVTQQVQRDELLLDLADRHMLHSLASALLYWQHCSTGLSRRRLSWIVAQKDIGLHTLNAAEYGLSKKNLTVLPKAELSKLYRNDHNQKATPWILQNQELKLDTCLLLSAEIVLFAWAIWTLLTKPLASINPLLCTVAFIIVFIGTAEGSFYFLVDKGHKTLFFRSQVIQGLNSIKPSFKPRANLHNISSEPSSTNSSTWRPLLQATTTESESFDAILHSMIWHEDIVQQVPAILAVLPELNLPSTGPEEISRRLAESEQSNKKDVFHLRLYRRLSHYVSAVMLKIIIRLEAAGILKK